MAITQELLDKIKQYEAQNYSANEIVSGLAESQNFPDIAEKVKGYSQQGYGADEILQGIKSSPLAAAPQVAPAQAVIPAEQMQRDSRYGYSYKPTGEAISPQQRKVEGAKIAKEQITPILQGTGAVLGGLAGGLLAIPLAGVGQAVGERLGGALAGEPVGTAGEEAKRFGTEAVKGAALELTGQVAGKAAYKSLDFLKNKLYESAVKLSTKLSIPERAKYVKAGIENAIFPTEKGLAKLGTKIDDVNKQIDNAIKIAGTKGQVSTSVVADQVENLKNRYQHSIDYDEIVEGLDDLKTKLLAKGPSLTAQEAQGMKIDLYRGLKKSYGEMKDFAVEGRKTLAHGLMGELEKLYPQIQGLNKQHAAFRGLEKEVERAAARISNRELISLLASTSAAAGGAAYQGPEGLTYGLAVQLLVSPRSKVGMSIALNNALKASGVATGLRRAVLPAIMPREEEQLKESIGSQTNYMR